MTFSVLAIDVRSDEIDLAGSLRGTAAKFRPHITVLPRFACSRTKERYERKMWRTVISRLAAGGALLIELRGLKWIEPDLAWYECDLDCVGRRTLEEVHRAALKDLSDCWFPQIDRRFIGSGYRPHMTVSWQASRDYIDQLPAVILAQATHLSVYHYHRDPRVGVVERVSIAQLG